MAGKEVNSRILAFFGASEPDGPHELVHPTSMRKLTAAKKEKKR
jgi:hypothetical protein